MVLTSERADASHAKMPWLDQKFCGTVPRRFVVGEAARSTTVNFHRKSWSAVSAPREQCKDDARKQDDLWRAYV